MTKREAAIQLAKKGFRVFPIPAGKKAASFEDFPNRASSDPIIVTELWSEAITGESEHHNIGIATGHPEGVMVLDCDVKHGQSGLADLDHFEAIGLDTSIRARTASGGIHVYFRLPPNVAVRSSVKKIRPGTDVRGYRGYVVAPGSDTDQGAYEWLAALESLADIPIAPNWLIRLCGAPIDRDQLSDEQPDFELNTGGAIGRAISYLRDVAPRAVSGEGGNDRTFAVAAAIRDLGVDEPTALDLLLDHWNDTKAEPPWQPNDLQTIVHNAYRYAQNSIGSISADAEFGPVYLKPESASPPKDPNWPCPSPDRDPDAADIPKREWIVEGVLARGFVTGLVAPSGAGKTQLTAQLMLAIATGRDDILNLKIMERASIWYWNQEDDLDELDRRKAAAKKHFGIDLTKAKPRFVNSGVDKPLILLARDPENRLRRTKHIETIVRHIVENEIDVWVVDPLVEFHEANENDNVEMRQVVAVLRYIAAVARCAVLFGHHTKKPDGASSDGFAGNADSGRGASALQGVTRVMLTLYAMSVKDARAFGVAEDDRRQYVRLDGAKSNIGAQGGRPRWFKWAEAQLQLDGDKIGVLEAVELAKAGSRVERQLDGLEALAGILAKRADAGESVRWPDVIPEFMDATQWSLKKVQRWMTEAPDGMSKTNSGELEIQKRGGNSGTAVRVSA